MDISDNPSFVPKLLQELQENFQSQVTKDIAFRKKQLESLLRGHEELMGEFDVALQKDLGYTPFMSFLQSHALTITEVKYTLDNFITWTKPTPINTPVLVGMGDSFVQPEPLGVALVISAWNYPVFLALPFTAVAIAAGNCVVLKPSEFAPATSHVLKKLFEKYLDPRFYRCVEGKSEVAKALTNSKFDIILFTGSTQTGTLVAQAAAKNLVPCVLELGGKCPVVVDKTADLAGAAMRIAQGRFMNSGQICVAADHLYIHNSIKKEFLQHLVEQTKALYGNDPQDSGDMGKIVSLEHVKRLEGYLKENHGGKVLCGGKVFQNKQFVQPTIVESPKLDSSLMREEIFGPILPVFGYDDLQKVIQTINSQPKPLTVYCFTEDEQVKEKLLKQTSSGAFVVNEIGMHLANPEFPFGGVGKSGYGRYHGKSGFDVCSNPKSVADLKILEMANMRFPPYTNEKAVRFPLNAASSYGDGKNGKLMIS
jgi:aldehyde dehydrogenase (NAD+)